MTTTDLTPAQVLELVAEYAETAQRHDHAVETAGDHSYEEGMWASEDALRDLDPALIRAHAKALAEQGVEVARLQAEVMRLRVEILRLKDWAVHERQEAWDAEEAVRERLLAPALLDWPHRKGAVLHTLVGHLSRILTPTQEAQQ